MIRVDYRGSQEPVSEQSPARFPPHAFVYHQRHVRVAIRAEPAFLSDAPGWVQRLVERWQFGGIFSWTSGAPLTITAPVCDDTGRDGSPVTTPNIVGDFPKSRGKVTKVGEWRDILS